VDTFDKFVIGVFVTLLILLSLVVFGLPIGTVVSEYKYCQTQERLSENFDFEWTLWTGCLIQLPDGSWSDAHEYLDKQRFELDGSLK
jgi:hypothetical protein